MKFRLFYLIKNVKTTAADERTRNKPGGGKNRGF